MLTYKIVGFNMLNGNLEVEFPKVGRLNILLCKDEKGDYPTGDFLHEAIIKSFPVEQYKLMTGLGDTGNGIELAYLAEAQPEAGFTVAEVEALKAPLTTTTVIHPEEVVVEKL